MKTRFVSWPTSALVGCALLCAPGLARAQAVPSAAGPAPTEPPQTTPAAPLRDDMPSYGGKTLDVWLEDLGTMPATPAYDPAADAVRHMGAAALPKLLQFLETRSDKTPLATTALQVLGEAARPAVPRLVELLQKKPSSGAAAEVLVNLREDQPVVAALASPELRRGALWALADEKVGEGAVGPIVPLLKDRDPSIRTGAAFALAHIGKGAALAVPGLMAAVDDPDPTVRQYARWALQQVNCPPKVLIPILIRGLEDPVAYQGRYNVCRQLGEVSRYEREQEDEVITALIGRLQDGDTGVRAEAVWALGNLINGRMGGEHPYSRNSKNTLAGFEAPGERIVSALAGALQDPAKEVRGAAVYALADIGTTRTRLDPVIVKILRACLKDQDERMRSLAQEGLKHLPPTPEDP